MTDSEKLPSALYVIATPIGNLGDLSTRARITLSAVDLIAAEDTRVTKKLLDRLEIPHGKLISYRDENELQAAPGLAEQIEQGARIGLVADAGTPTLSDPGFRLVRECRRRGLPVVPVPGPFALAAALSVSGLPTDAFFFAGFLPPKSAARRRFLEEHLDYPHTIVLYESVHRIEKLSAEMLEILGADRIVCIARELTKLHETVLTGTLGEVLERLLKGKPKGEFVILIAPATYSL